MEALEEGDRWLFTSSTKQLLQHLPSVTTLGGRCGTEARASLWDVPAQAAECGRGSA